MRLITSTKIERENQLSVRLELYMSITVDKQISEDLRGEVQEGILLPLMRKGTPGKPSDELFGNEEALEPTFDEILESFKFNSPGGKMDIEYHESKQKAMTIDDILPMPEEEEEPDESIDEVLDSFEKVNPVWRSDRNTIEELFKFDTSE